MKNLKVSAKLIVGFGTVLLLLIIVATLSMLSLFRIGDQIESYRDFTLPNNTILWSIRRDTQSIQRNMAIGMSETSSDKRAAYFDNAKQDAEHLLGDLEKYANNQRDNSRDAKIEELRVLYASAGNTRREIVSLISVLNEENFNKAKRLFDEEYISTMDKATDVLVAFTDVANERADKQAHDATAAMSFAFFSLIISSAAAIVIATLMIFIIRKSILAPVKEIGEAFEEISKGNMQRTVRYESQDELGQMASLIQKSNQLQSEIVADVIDKFTKISLGDLQFNIELDYPGEFASLKEAMERTVLNLNNTMHNINTAAEQVNIGASQVSDGAQALATGSTEQAASVEELSASIIEVAGQAERNLDTVKNATLMTARAGQSMENGNAHMTQLSEAMIEIGASSNQIANITKVIEDIAFQTNILALNAAVEAARAGSAGKGFAVVADEVRSLAAKSAEAAKETVKLIQDSVETVSRGTQITAETAAILQEVVIAAQQVVVAMSQIEQSTESQSIAIEQIKDGLSQVSSVVQTNAATAEENSATSEEMSAQAATLRQEVGKFKLMGGNAQESGLAMSLTSGRHSKISLPESSFSLGKY